jgi:pyruvate/2-oxoglutarate dehydrogenase complex dihydrolipoamide dehydrogenase (E3) component
LKNVIKFDCVKLSVSLEGRLALTIGWSAACSNKGKIQASNNKMAAPHTPYYEADPSREIKKNHEAVLSNGSPTQRNKMPEIEHYDAIVLGTGEAGKFMSWHLGGSGKRVAAIERKYLGGACPNIACLPSKNVIHSAQVASYFGRGAEFGMMTDKWSVSMPRVRARKREMVEGLLQIHRDNFTRNKVEVVMGEGRFISERMLKVSLNAGGERILQGDQVFINVGTRAEIPNLPGMAEASPLTHVEALELDVVPEHLLILGGGYVGLEFAQAMRRLGSRVTVMERNGRLLHREDADVSQAITQLFQDEGIVTVTNTCLGRVEGKSGQGVRLHGSRRGSEIIVEGSHLLVATGRLPNTEGTGLESAGIKTTKKGFIQVNDRLETTAPSVWALGDCTGGPVFTHISFDDFRIVRDNLDGAQRTTKGRQVPSCLFTDPELASIGLDETQAKEQGIPYRVSRIPMASVLRTRTLSETRGFLKALISTTDDRILGFTGFGVGAGETMATIQLAMKAGIPYTFLRDMTITHPTLAEGIVVLFSAVPALEPLG